MKEIEVKILDIDREELIKKLDKLGAVRKYDLLVEDYFFKCRSGEVLRIRKIGSQIILTHKGQRDRMSCVKQREETEILSNDLDSSIKFLERLGFHQNLKNIKRRMKYEYKNSEIIFDKYLGEKDFIPEFIEIEAESKNKIIEIAKNLDFTEDDFFSGSTRDLVDKYKE